jgi:hypothetical protein
VLTLKTLSVSFHLVPFAGLAFLWFIAVVRDRVGEFEPPKESK